MRQRRWLFGVLAVMLIFSTPSETWARTQAEVVADAKRLVDQAIDADNAKQYGQASKWSTQAAALLQKEAPDEWELTESALNLAGMSEMRLDHNDEAAKLFKDALKLAGAHRSRSDRFLGMLNQHIAFAIGGTKYGGDSIPYYAQAIEILAQHATDDTAKSYIRVAFNNLSAIHIDRNEIADAQKVCDRWLAFENVITNEPEHDRYTKIHRNLAWLHERNSDFVSALAALRQSLTIATKALGSQHADVEKIRNEIAEVKPVGSDEELRHLSGQVQSLLIQDEYERAMPIARRTASSAQALHGVQSYESAAALEDLALIFQEEKRYGRSALLFQQASSILESMIAKAESGDASPPGNASMRMRSRAFIIQHNLGATYMFLKEPAKAEEAWRKGLQLITGMNDNNLTTTKLITLMNLSNMFLTRKQDDKLAEIEPALVDAINLLSERSVYKEVYFQLYKIAEYLEERTFLERAEQIYMAILKMVERFDRSTARNAKIANDLAFLYRKMSRFSDAEKLYLTSINIESSARIRNDPERAVTLFNLAVLYVQKQKYGDAERLLLQAKEILVTAPTSERQREMLSSVLTTIGDTYSKQQDYARAAPVFRELAAHAERTHGADHPVLATVLDRLSQTYRDTGDFEKAIPLARRALEIVDQKKDRSPELSHLTTTFQSNLTVLLMTAKKYDEAERHLAQLLAATAGETTAFRALLLSNMGSLEHRRSQNRKAEQWYQQSIDLCDKIPEAMNNEEKCAWALAGLGKIYKEEARFKDSSRLLEKGLRLAEKTHGPLALITNEARRDLMTVLEALGRSDLAAEVAGKALATTTQAVGGNASAALELMEQQASSLTRQGKLLEAEQLLLQVLNRIEAQGGTKDTRILSPLLTLSEVYKQIRQHDKALAMIERALTIAEANKPEITPKDWAHLLNQQGLILIELKQLAKAEQVLKRLKELRLGIDGANSKDYAVSLNNLALVYLSWGQTRKAEPLLREAIAIGELLGRPLDPDLSTWRDNLAAVYSQRGEYAEEAKLREKALEIYEQTIGLAHPDTKMTLRHLALTRLDQRNMMEVVRLLTRWLEADHSLVKQLVSEERIEKWKDPTIDNLLYSLSALADPLAQRLALATALLHKGRTLDLRAKQARAQLALRQSPELREQVEKLARLRAELEAAIWSTGADGVTASDKLKRLRDEVRSAEEQLALAVPSLKTELSHELPPPSQIVERVAAALPKDSALIEIVNMRPISDLSAADYVTSEGLAQQYVALLLFPSGKYVAVPLGKTEPIDRNVGELLSLLRTPSSKPQPIAEALYKLVMAPLAPHLSSVQQLFISTDGSLQLLPWAAMHDGKQYVLHAYRSMVYLTSGRDLLRLGGAPARSAPLLIGAPDFQHSRELFADDPIGGKSAALGLYASVQNLAALPGTRREVEQIGAMIPTARVWQDSSASEEGLKQQSAPLLLHIATHGIFLDAGPTRPTAPDIQRAIRPNLPTMPMIDGTAVPAVAMADPMSLSALLFAGSANAKAGVNPEQDGVLTAQEASLMDLWGTELVVLSACDSARGSLTVGEGVYGLRRAFFIAGAETLVASAWPISDRETVALMQRYYRLLLQGKPRAQAMTAAAREMQRTHAHPYYWAPFSVFGQDTPLRLHELRPTPIPKPPFRRKPIPVRRAS